MLLKALITSIDAMAQSGFTFLISRREAYMFDWLEILRAVLILTGIGILITVCCILLSLPEDEQFIDPTTQTVIWLLLLRR